MVNYTISLFFIQGRLCNQPMGLQNGRLRNHLMKASSQWDRYHAAFLGRLHRPRVGKYMGAWCARSNNRYQYLQLDFTRLAKIIKMAIQGRHDANQWVTQYYITHSVNAINFEEYKERNNRKVKWCISYICKRALKFITNLTVDCVFGRRHFLRIEIYQSQPRRDLLRSRDRESAWKQILCEVVSSYLLSYGYFLSCLVRLLSGWGH